MQRKLNKLIQVEPSEIEVAEVDSSSDESVGSHHSSIDVIEQMYF